jgi:hypothetical protein
MLTHALVLDKSDQINDEEDTRIDMDSAIEVFTDYFF